jgi:hypothetical protein
MLNAIILLVGAVVAWVVIDQALLWRNQRLRRGTAAWSGFGADRTFHSTGWEETVPPAEATDPHLEQLRGRAA